MVIDELGEYSTLIQQQNSRISCFQKADIRVVSVSECQLTPSVIKASPSPTSPLLILTIGYQSPEGDQYCRTGPPIVMVSKTSAIMGIAKEIHISHRADHSKLVKFPTKEDPMYLKIAGHIREFLDYISGDTSKWKLIHGHPSAVLWLEDTYILISA